MRRIPTAVVGRSKRTDAIARVSTVGLRFSSSNEPQQGATRSGSKMPAVWPAVSIPTKDSFVKPVYSFYYTLYEEMNCPESAKRAQKCTNKTFLALAGSFALLIVWLFYDCMSCSEDATAALRATAAQQREFEASKQQQLAKQ